MTALTRINFEDIKVGDTIQIGYDEYVGSEDQGVALRLEPLFDDDVRRPGPVAETVWYFDGMAPLGSWMKAEDIYRVED